MKIFNHLIITAFLIPFLPLSAETEEASLTSLDEELSLLDEEFEEFKEELYSLENDLQKPGFEESTAPEVLALESEAPLILDTDPELMPNIMVAEVLEDLPAPEISEIEEPLVALKTEATPVVPVVQEKKSEFPIVQEKKPEAPIVQEKKLEAPLKIEREAPAVLNVQGTSLFDEPMAIDEDEIAIDLGQAFEGSPVIYSLLFAMSVIAVGIWLYSILSLRVTARVSPQMLKNLENRLNSNHFDEALTLCDEKNDLFSKMIASGIHSRRHGLPVMIEAMKAEGKRASIAFWQKIGLLNDIAIIAPMLGLLGTVLGMFYAFYDVNRSIESISTLFDGLGISVGTTVAGLVVAILALILHSTAKFRLVRALTLVENEAQSVATIIDDRTSIYKG
jgi:biopolymer transport protein ExbB